MFRWDAYLPTLFKLLLPKIRYMGDKKCGIHLEAMREIYIMTVFNLKTVRDKCPPLPKTLMMLTLKLLKTIPRTTAFDVKYDQL